MVNACINNYKELTNNSFENFISIGFRDITDNLLLAGQSNWCLCEQIQPISGAGIFKVNCIDNIYELANLSKKSIILKSPINIISESKSYLINPLATMIITYLGE